MPPHPLTYFEIQNIIKQTSQSKGWSIHIKSWWVQINKNTLGSFVGNNLTYFDSSGVEHIPEKIEKIIGNKIITTNIHRIQAYDSVICDAFFIGFMKIMQKNEKVLDYTNFFFST